jgi:hypothetical protein
MLVYLWNGGTLPWDALEEPECPFIDDKDPLAYNKGQEHLRNVKKYQKAVIKNKRSHNAKSLIPTAPQQLKTFV